MSYTSPAGNATNFAAGAAYSARPGDSTNFQFEVGDLRLADSWRAARIGTPLCPVAHTGWLTTQFGVAQANFRAAPVAIPPIAILGQPRRVQLAPVGVYAPTTQLGTHTLAPTPTPIRSTALGTPNSPYVQTCAATGFLQSQLSAPRLTGRYFAFAATPSTIISQAYKATAQTVAAAGAMRTRLGAPIYRAAAAVSIDRTANVAAINATLLGTPASRRNQTSAPQGFGLVRLGWPRSTRAGPSAVFGVPTGGRAGRATGWLAGTRGSPSVARFATTTGQRAQFGIAVARAVYAASPPSARARIGAPTSLTSGQTAYGIDLGRRFGVPTSTNRINRATTGARGTALGAPVCVERHRAAHAAPTAQFGGARLIRTPTC